MDRRSVAAHPAAGLLRTTPCRPTDGLTVISLNIAHGRGGSFNQLLLRAGTIRAKLGRIAAMLAREQADVVALQEAE